MFVRIVDAVSVVVVIGAVFLAVVLFATGCGRLPEESLGADLPEAELAGSSRKALIRFVRAE